MIKEIGFEKKAYRKNTGQEKKMEKRIPRVAALHDLSCFGRCALTVIMPALSTLGVQCVPLPTALLSTHTGGFDNIAVHSLTDQMKPIYSHWESLGLSFDAIYSGYLEEEKQAEILEDFISRFRKKNTLVLVDPVFADDGSYYSRTTDALVEAMRSLCSHADLITPNLTEACYLLHIDPAEAAKNPMPDFAASLLLSLRLAFGTPRIVITGIPLCRDGQDEIGTAALDEGEGKTPFFVSLPRVGSGYPGTGDLFASVLLGCLLSGISFARAVELSSCFTRGVILRSLEYDTPAREGVALEPSLKELSCLIEKEKREFSC